MDAKTVKSYFNSPIVVSDYLEAAKSIGLWESEKIVFKNFLAPEMKVLELGCGAGRIALGLAKIGFENVLATDVCENMVEAAKSEAAAEGISARFEVCDATAMTYADESFDAAIFGFNGLMQIPKYENRSRATREISRVLKNGGVLIFTTHDRSSAENKKYWDDELKQWNSRAQNPVLDEFGDLYYNDGRGNVFIHSPTEDEITSMLADAGFSVELRRRRSWIAQESARVADFSDDCLFWAAKKNARQS